VEAQGRDLENHVQAMPGKDEMISAQKKLELLKENRKRMEISRRIHKKAARHEGNIDDEIKSPLTRRKTSCHSRREQRHGSGGTKQ
jgi:hypothetical protein